MLKDIRLHGSISPAVDFFATLAGENLLPTQFYEVREGPSGTEYSFFLQGQYLKVTPEGIHFSGNGGVVSEYMFGSTMPLQDLGHKEVRNRLVLFGAYASDGGLRFTACPDAAGVPDLVRQAAREQDPFRVLIADFADPAGEGLARVSALENDLGAGLVLLEPHLAHEGGDQDVGAVTEPVGESPEPLARFFRDRRRITSAPAGSPADDGVRK